ncbi:MAG: sigma-54-dependent Fis family transcriptional regulator [bacterium]|nr:sigma-54-dependent Fis family transcriptional regulator [bacterium]
MADILLLEDKRHLRALLKNELVMRNYRVDEATTLEMAAWKLDQGRYDVVILDLKLPDGDSTTLFDKYREQLKGKSIIITANASVPSVVEAIKKGAYNYLEKPVEPELLAAQVQKVIELNRLQYRQQSVIDDASANFTFNSIIFKSREMEVLTSRAKVMAGTDNNILLQGETGCGKEVLSHSIHNGSQRKNEILLPVNCASIPADLFETELFGFRKGAFTGAVDSYGGRFVQADKGTLFLDEIGELPLQIQAKLLRVLDERKIYHLKSQNSTSIDVRLIAATNRDLWKEVKLNRFRSDLFYRLNEFTLKIPPLKERVDDILPLLNHFIRLFNHIFNKNVTRISAEAQKYLQNYPWDGNVRELKNTIKSIIPFKNDNTISMEDLSYSIVKGGEAETKNVPTMEECEKRHIYKVLKLTDFNILRTSELLGMYRSRLYRKIKEYGLKLDENDAPDDAGTVPPGTSA